MSESLGPMIAAAWRKHRPKPGTTWRLDEAYMKVGGRMVYRGDAFGA